MGQAKFFESVFGRRRIAQAAVKYLHDFTHCWQHSPVSPLNGHESSFSGFLIHIPTYSVKGTQLEGLCLQ